MSVTTWFPQDVPPDLAPAPFRDVWSGNPETDRAWRATYPVPETPCDPLAGDVQDETHAHLRDVIGAPDPRLRDLILQHVSV